MGGCAAVVAWRGGDLRTFLSGRGAMARGHRAPAASEGDGAGDEVRVPDAVLVLGRRVGHVVDRLDPGERRAGPAPASGPPRRAAYGRRPRGASAACHVRARARCAMV